VPYTVGVGLAGDAFYGPREEGGRDLFRKAHIVSVEMESDALFIIGQYRGWRTGAAYTSDGTATEIKPDWGWDKYKQGELDCINISLEAMYNLAKKDQKV
jgi:uridine phosphorylase